MGMRPCSRYLAFGMRYIIPTGLALAPFLLLIQPALAFERPAPPQGLFGDLYADVELERIFPDSKEFADATAHRRALDAVDPRRADCVALFVATAAATALCRAWRPIPRALLLGLV